MSDYLVTNYNPKNISYMQNHVIGSSVQPVNKQITSTNFKGKIALDYPPGTVEISAKNKVKKQGISTGIKVLLGATGLMATAFVHHKFIHPKIIQKRVQDIFLKDVTKEEAFNIQKKYRDILKIQNKDEFVDKMLAELKADYKLENIPIKLNKDFKAGEQHDAVKAAAVFSAKCYKGHFLISVDKNFSNEELFKQMTHEMRHAKQELTGWQSVNKDEFLAIYKDKIRDTFSGEEKCTEEWVNEAALDCWQERFDFYNKLGIKNIDKNDRNYDWAKKVMESMRTYANKSKDNYKSVFYETDAKSTENLMWKMINNKFF